MTELPLDGVRVIDLAGPMGTYGTKLLADFGADVVKVEPLEGDLQRRRPPFAQGAAEGEGSLLFAYYNANKRSVALDLGAADAESTLARLAAGADLVIIAPTPDNPIPGFDPGTRTLSWADPRSIVCCLSAFGFDGPFASYRATHLTSFAASGQMHVVGPAEGPPRALPGFALHDELSAHAAAVMMIALRERDRLGPQRVELALHDLLAYRDTMATASYVKGGGTVNVRGVFAGGAPPTGIWAVADGLVELLVYNPPHWDGFLELLGHPQELADSDLRDRAVRTARTDELIPVIAALFALRRLDDVLEAAERFRVPCAPQYTPAQATHDAQFAGREYWTTQDGPGTGPIRVPGRPFRANVELLGQHRRPAPLLGEHTAELLAAAPEARPESPVGSEPASSGPPRLTELKVLSFGTAIAGNVSATMLAELGADVVKIESPGRPDPLRRGPISPLLPRVFEADQVETNVMFAGYSRSCRSIGLDMKDPADQATFVALARQADVLIDNFATGVMASWGLGHDTLAEINPRLIMVSVSGYGRTGPRAKFMAYGSTINSFMGLTRTWSPHGTQFDYTAVAHVLPAVFAALAHRDRAGVGAIIDIAQIEAGAAMLAPLYLPALNSDDDSALEPNEVPGSAFVAVVPTSGTDQWLAVEAETAADFAALAALVGRPELIVEHPTELRESLGDWAAAHTAAEAERLAQQAGVAAAWVRAVGDEWEDPQMWARGLYTAVDHPDLGRLYYVNGFQRFSRLPVYIRRPSARLGQHTTEVIAEWLPGADPSGEAGPADPRRELARS
ncbi:MAG: Crotonobetainyl-CoA:carnitine CoA-transferase CaiB [Pseudonocardiales bacterium]|nr:Crotonobetainyl-CoA:carnitine CoA-transferase CaiB [Pseudonocardiales bacterium]